MPANLTHVYRKAEEEYRHAQTPAEQVACLENMLAVIPKHKGTEHLQADLRTRLKEARAEVQSEKTSAAKGRSFRIPRQGAGTVVLIGAPNSGRSRIVAELTNAEPEVAVYPFTTREPFPAMMPCDGALVQLIDTPPVADGHVEPYLVNYVRSADLVLLCVDGSSDDAPDETLAVLRQFEMRKTLLSDSTGFDENDFSTLHVRTLLVMTRGEDPDLAARIELLCESLPRDVPLLPVELTEAASCETLRQRIVAELGVIRVYTKAPGKPAVYEEPFTVPRGGTVEDLALCVHRELAEKLKFARVWGEGVHDGQSVGRDHLLTEGDMVELHT
ncbi:MAG: TGS domain-containing protein [Planctomycetota bacterium]|nr:TGS domain-containing protein [Planctomycetota bacterium]